MAADRSQMLTSSAYQALTPAARKVLAVIEGKIADGGGCVCRGTMRGSGTPVCGGTNARAKKGPEYGETIGALQGGEDSAAAPEARQQIRMHRSRCMRVDMDQTMRRGTIRSAVLP